MSSRAFYSFAITIRFICLVAFFSATALWASVSGSISGTVKDPSGSVITDAQVSVKESNTGLAYQTHTDSKGHYTFPVLPVGHYVLDVAASGFGEYKRTEIVLNTNAALTLDASLTVGGASENVTVTDNTLHVETESTQLGQVITGRQMTAVPLDGRSFTDLLSLQPGVAPQTAITDTTVQDVGATVFAPSGTLNPGTLSVRSPSTATSATPPSARSSVRHRHVYCRVRSSFRFDRGAARIPATKPHRPRLVLRL